MDNGAAAGQADQFAAAHQALRADPSIQFDFTPPPPPPQTPPWLKAVLEWLGDLLAPVGRFLAWIGSFFPDSEAARFFLWTVLALAAGALLWAIYQRVITGAWRLPSFRSAPPVDFALDEPAEPQESQVREWLREADALAEQGRYAEAIHHLLFRSIEDISRRRPDVVRPALTSREISATRAIPERARDLFTRIVGLVEPSLFGGRPVDSDDWKRARADYAGFALPEAWRA